MINWNEKTKATNAIFLDNATPGKGRYFKARFLETGLVKYSFGVCLLTKENADKFVYNFVGCPIIVDHHDLTDENAKTLRAGNICNVWYSEFDAWYWCDGIIDSQEAIDCINNGFSVSCQYEITEYADNTAGELHNGNEYDKTILNGKPEHLAIVENPRYENALIAVNAICKNKQNNDTTKKQGETMDELKEMFGMLKDAVSFGLKASNACKNEDDKKDEKAENKCKNEDEDKRKLIDEVGGILKGKVDDEIIRTIIKKMEEASYEKSEAGTADNKCKNEDKEDKKEDKEAENKKSKNEEDKKDEDKAKNEDGKEKEEKKDEYEEFKEKVKEEAENKKAKNSMDEMTKKFFEGGQREKQKIYMTQKEGIELGKKLY